MQGQLFEIPICEAGFGIRHLRIRELAPERLCPAAWSLREEAGHWVYGL
jgi:hypothetical protein